METIMMATDFSERSDRALRRATLLAKQHKAEITLIHVVDDDKPAYIVDSEKRQAEDLLRKLTRTTYDEDGITCDARVIVSAPFAGIVQGVADVSPDLLIIGPHRRQLLKDAFVGTTAERAIRSVDCPVLMVNAPPVARYGHILETTDLSEVSAAAIRRFSSLGIGRTARHSLLYVYDVPALGLVRLDTPSKEERAYFEREERDEAAQKMREFLGTIDDTIAETFLRHQVSSVEREILDAANEHKADLIVISPHGRGGLEKLFLGSVAQQILSQSPIDVLIVPPQHG